MQLTQGQQRKSVGGGRQRQAPSRSVSRRTGPQKGLLSIKNKQMAESASRNTGGFFEKAKAYGVSVMESRALAKGQGENFERAAGRVVEAANRGADLNKVPMSQQARAKLQGYCQNQVLKAANKFQKGDKQALNDLTRYETVMRSFNKQRSQGTPPIGLVRMGSQPRQEAQRIDAALALGRMQKISDLRGRMNPSQQQQADRYLKTTMASAMLRVGPQRMEKMCRNHPQLKEAAVGARKWLNSQDAFNTTGGLTSRGKELRKQAMQRGAVRLTDRSVNRSEIMVKGQVAQQLQQLSKSTTDRVGQGKGLLQQRGGVLYFGKNGKDDPPPTMKLEPTYKQYRGRFQTSADQLKQAYTYLAKKYGFQHNEKENRDEERSSTKAILEANRREELEKARQNIVNNFYSQRFAARRAAREERKHGDMAAREKLLSLSRNYTPSMDTLQDQYNGPGYRFG